MKTNGGHIKQISIENEINQWQYNPQKEILLSLLRKYWHKGNEPFLKRRHLKNMRNYHLCLFSWCFNALSRFSDFSRLVCSSSFVCFFFKLSMYMNTFEAVFHVIENQRFKNYNTKETIKQRRIVLFSWHINGTY